MSAPNHSGLVLLTLTAACFPLFAGDPGLRLLYRALLAIPLPLVLEKCKCVQ